MRTTFCSGEGSSDSYRLSLLEHLGVKISGLPDSRRGLHLSLVLLVLAGVGDLNLEAGTTLQRRDCIIEQGKVTLRLASFLSDRLFNGHPKPVVARLEDSAQDLSLQKSIKTSSRHCILS